VGRKATQRVATSSPRISFSDGKYQKTEGIRGVGVTCRTAITSVWVLTTVAALSGMAVVLVTHAAGFLRRAWLSLIVQLHSVSHGAQVGNVPDVLVGAVGAFILLLPVAGITFTYLMTCRGAGVTLAVRRSRIDLTLAAPAGEESPQRNSVRFLTKPASGGKPSTQSPWISEGDKACAG
jgi:hypothetical protein